MSDSNLELIEKELDAFMDWPTNEKGLVTRTSCILFARHIQRKAIKERDAALAELERFRRDTERLNFMISEMCIIESQSGLSGNPVYSIYWTCLGESQPEWFHSPREAIDAALNQQQAEVKP